MSDFKIPKKIKKSSSTKKPLNPNLINFTLILFSILLAGMVAFKLYLTSLSPIRNLYDFKPNIVTKFYSHDGEIIKTFTAFTFSKVGIEEIPADLKNAIIATEDKNFYTHPGYDLTGLVRSVFANIMAGRVVQGASTITQQLARILFLSNEKTFTRKIKELIVAVRIEKTIPKEKILEMYLNNVYLGSGAYGIAGAAEIYFNKPLNELTLAECALIAGLPQAPSVYSPFHSKELSLKRRNKVLKRMYKMHFITKQQYREAKDEKLTLNPMPEIYTFNKAPYFCDYVMKDLDTLGFDEVEISQGGYKIITTLDSKAQKATNESIIKIMNAWGLKGKKRQAALFSFSPVNGRILAYAGGKNYSESQYDRVTQAIRPPGSAFKPLVYATALEKDSLSPNDMMEDTPFKVGDWAPKNYGSKYRGKIPAYKALMISSNVCAARLMQEVGIRSVIQMARVLGITTPLEYDFTIALGSNGVKLLEITRAYGAFANGGYKVQPYAIEKIETSRGKVVYEASKTKSLKVMELNSAASLTAMLKTVIQFGTGKVANINKPAAGKTGTTDDYKDAWFIGYTPDIVTGVWVGNDDNSKNSRITGGTVPALIWKAVMTVATEPYGAPDFDYPSVYLKPYSPDPQYLPKDEAEEAEGEVIDNSQNQNSEQNLQKDISGLFTKKGDSGSTAKTSQKQSNQKNKPSFAPIPVVTPIDVKN